MSLVEVLVLVELFLIALIVFAVVYGMIRIVKYLRDMVLLLNDKPVPLDKKIKIKHNPKIKKAMNKLKGMLEE